MITKVIGEVNRIPGFNTIDFKIEAKVKKVKKYWKASAWVGDSLQITDIDNDIVIKIDILKVILGK